MSNNPHFVAHALIDWYSGVKRDLPWRRTTDPYRIWVSEIILQQTRVDQGLPYYERFIEAFPNIQSLAAADEREVLRIWQGLGYYSRARNMHATANHICHALNGIFPDRYEGLIQLKGIGPYTAAAIASFAFNEARPVVDGNVFRFASRFFGITADIAKGKTRKLFEEVLADVIPEEQPGDFNQAIMEFGSLVCKPSPLCGSCPLREACVANKTGRIDELPVKTVQKKLRKRIFHYLVFRWEDRLAVNRRVAGDIWEGLYQFYLFEGELASDSDWKQDFDLEFTHLTEVRHLLSHQELYVHFWIANLGSANHFARLLEDAGLEQASLEEMLTLPKPKVINDFVLNYLI